MCPWLHHLEIPDEGLLPLFFIHCLQHLSGPTRGPGGVLERWPGLRLPQLVIPQPHYFQNAVPPHLLSCLVLVHASREHQVQVAIILCHNYFPFVGNASSKFPSWGSFTPRRSLDVERLEA